MRTDSSTVRALLILAVGVTVLVSRSASACGWVDAPPLDVSFDGALLGVPGFEPLLYDPSTWGFYSPCGCELDEQKADWSKYLSGIVAWEDWQPVLSSASLDEIDALILALKSDKSPRPPAYANSALFAKRSAVQRKKLISALYLVGFARRVEPFAHFELANEWADQPNKLPPRPPDSEALSIQSAGEGALKQAHDDFFRQRYAFLLTRLAFYRKDWKGTLAFFDSHAKQLAGPSASLSYRARYYAAGAALHDAQEPRGGLELARVFAGFPDLAALATNDFGRFAFGEWSDSFSSTGNEVAADSNAPWSRVLALAHTPDEKTALWTFLGIRGDGISALQQIAKLAPDSSLPALLAVREIQRLEMWPKPEGFKNLDAVVEPLASLPQHGWLYALVRGHSAALQADVAGARRWLQQAEQARPKDPMVTRQAAVSLVIALAHASNSSHQQYGDELMQRLAALPQGPVSKYGADNKKVREKVGATVGAAALASWTPERIAGDPSSVLYSLVKSDPDALLAGFRLASSAKTPFEKFIVSGVHRDALAEVTVQSLVVHGRFAEAASVAEALPEKAPLTLAIPREEQIKECYQCSSDHDETLTQKALVQRLVKLEKTANGQGEAAARAAFEIGRILMHLTLLDINAGDPARTVPPGTWFARAYATSADRELKARAAFFAARCEMLDGKNRYGWSTDRLVSKTWYPRLAGLAGTKFEQEVLAECGYFRKWSEKAAQP